VTWLTVIKALIGGLLVSMVPVYLKKINNSRLKTQVKDLEDKLALNKTKLRKKEVESDYLFTEKRKLELKYFRIVNLLNAFIIAQEGNEDVLKVLNHINDENE